MTAIFVEIVNCTNEKWRNGEMKAQRFSVYDVKWTVGHLIDTSPTGRAYGQITYQMLQIAIKVQLIFRYRIQLPDKNYTHTHTYE